MLDDFRATSPGLFLYCPNGKQALPKLRAFIEHMKVLQALGRD
ncbi:hypothetical protein [Chelativorans sp. YIM 93263]|nr:hypothetical protein [Chelativorans sp. YIM 93263]